MRAGSWRLRSVGQWRRRWGSREGGSWRSAKDFLRTGSWRLGTAGKWHSAKYSLRAGSWRLGTAGQWRSAKDPLRAGSWRITGLIARYQTPYFGGSSSGLTLRSYLDNRCGGNFGDHVSKKFTVFRHEHLFIFLNSFFT